MSGLPDAFLRALKADFPPDFFSEADEDKATYGRDWTKVFSPAPCGVTFPRTTDQVARLLRLCSLHRISVVPSGGRTGLAGGAVAARGELVLSLERMRTLHPVDPVARTVRVQAGAVTEAVHHHCAPHQLTWPVDFASKGSSQVGGNIATNAGGVRVVRYGLTRNWVLGLQVVTMDGTVHELNGALEKNNTGVDLRQLFIGSEGTLGIITEATLKLTDVPKSRVVYLFAMEGLPAALSLFHHARARGPFTLNAFELFTDGCLKVVCEEKKVRSPLEANAPAYVLLEAEPLPGDGGRDALDGFLAELFEQGRVLDGTMAASIQAEAELWTLREGISESLYRKGLLHKNDIALPIAELAAFVPEMVETFRGVDPSLEVYVFGHIGDGNLHVNTVKPAQMADAAFHTLCEAADERLFALVQKHKGSVSAEHGIGLLKKRALRYSRTPQEVAIFRGLKKVFDPEGLLNPGKIFDI